MLTLNGINQIKDKELRELFQEIKARINSDMFFNAKLRLFEFTIDSDTANFKIRHSLGFRPLDVIQTYKSGTGTITWNYEEFDREFIDVSTAGGSVSVRALVGKIKE